jgi:hypothetical protein
MPIDNNDDEMREAEHILEQGFPEWDAERVEGLKDLAVISQSKTVLQARELNRLERKYGVNHPLTQQVAGKIALAAAFTDAVETEIVRSETPFTDTSQPSDWDISGWQVRGRVTGANKEGVGGLTVRVFDKDLMLDDALGETRTDSQGFYRLNFTKEQFSDFTEKYPELYLIIEDEKGNQLYNGKHETQYRAGHVELINIQLKRNRNKT